MIRKETILVFLLGFINFAAISQNVRIRGNIVDSVTISPVSEVEILIDDNAAKAVTDENGFFSFSVKSLPVTIQLRHISFNTKVIVLSENQNNFHFVLTPKSFNLNPIEITVNSPVQVMPDKHYHIMDYEFYNDRMILLAYENQSFLVPVLLLVNLNGDTLSRLEVSKPVKLCKDFNGKVFLYTRNCVWAVNIDSSSLTVSDPVNIEKFEAINNVIIAKSGNNFYLKEYYLSHQELDYFRYEEINDTLIRFKTIVDEDNIKRNRKGYYFDGKEEDIRFQQLIMLKPVYAPLICLRDTLFLFNFTESKLERYSASAEPIGETDLGVYNNSFKKEVLVDASGSKVYFLFRENGLSTIKEINPDNGKIIRTISIPSFVFVEKIKVNKDIVYFLYKEKYNQEYKKLYRFKI